MGKATINRLGHDKKFANCKRLPGRVAAMVMDGIGQVITMTWIELDGPFHSNRLNYRRVPGLVICYILGGSSHLVSGL